MAVFPSAEAFRDYVERHKQEIIEQAFLTFTSADHMDHVPDNKGKVVLLKGKYAKKTIKKWKKLQMSDFEQHGDLIPVTVASYLVQHIDTYTPTQLEQSYLGERRRRGQSFEDFPFMQFFIELAAKSLAAQMEVNIFQSAVVANSEEGDEQYDAILERLKQEVTAANLTPVIGGTPWLPPVGGGNAPVGSDHLINILENQYDTFPEEIKKQGVKCFMRPGLASMYNRTYRNIHRQGATVDQNLNRMVLDASLDYAPAEIIPCPGMGDSNRIVMTPRDNIYYTYDASEDDTSFNFQYLLNTLYMWSDFRYGSGFYFYEDDLIRINELE